MLKTLVTRNHILSEINNTQFLPIVTRLTNLLDDEYLLNREGFIEDVRKRELEACTSIAPGVLLPHARSRQVTRLGLALATLAQPAILSGPDPVQLVFLIAIPAREIRTYLQVVAELSRLLHDQDLVTQLLTGMDAAAIEQLLLNRLS